MATKNKQKKNAVARDILLTKRFNIFISIASGLILLLVGVYLIISYAAASYSTIVGPGGKCLDNYRQQKVNGNKIELYTCNSSNAQKWSLNSNKTITNANGYCLDVKSAGKTAGTIVQLYVCNGTVAQQWTVTTTNGVSKLVNPNSKMCLTAKDGKTANGTQIQIYTCNGSIAQQWKIKAQASSPPSTSVSPKGLTGSWKLAFSDEFSGTSVDTNKWTYQSSAESDWSSKPFGTGNPGNQQLEFDQPANCSVSGGILNLNAKPGNITSQSGKKYAWTSCLVTTKSYAFRYGYMEVSAKFPANKGFWPAFWTWAAPGQNLGANGETDAFEYYSDNKSNLYLSQHQGSGGGCTYKMPFDPTAGFHIYGVDLQASGTSWYVDSKKVCTVPATSSGMTNIILDNFVYSKIPPAAGSTGTTQFDYVRAWQH